MNRIIKIVFSIIFLLYSKTKILISLNKHSSNLIVIYYHSINKTNKFEKQISYLANNFNLVQGSFNNIDLNHQNILVTFDDALVSVKTNAIPILKKYKVPCIIFVPTGLLGKEPSWEVYGEKLYKNDHIMTEQDLLKIINDHSIILGSHTHTHKDLRKVDKNILEQELLISKQVLEKISGNTITSFSFPYGSYDEEIVEKIIGLGYQRIFTSRPENIDLTIEKNTLGRVSVNPENNFLEFWLKVNGAYSWIPVAVKLKKKIKRIFNISARL